MTFVYIEIFLKVMLCLAPVYILLRLLFCQYKKMRCNGYETNVKREAYMSVFFLYVAGILIMTLVMDGRYSSIRSMLAYARNRVRVWEDINLIPFRTITHFLKDAVGRDVFLINIVGNIVMFIPWGFGLGLLWKENRKAVRMIAWSVALPLFIETMQLFVGRSVDIDDWILNFIGSLLGGLLCGLWKVTNRHDLM